MPNKKFLQITKQIEKLQKEAAKARAAGVKGVIEKITGMMAEHGISLSELRTAGTRRKRGRPAKAKAGAKAAGTKRRGRRAAPKAGKVAKTTKASKARTKRRSSVKPKYRSPENRSITWSGRGRAPQWVKSWVSSGKSLDALLISKG